MKQSITIWQHKSQGKSFTITLDRGDGTGYRIVGPKLNGTQVEVMSHELTERDKEEVLYWVKQKP